MPSLIVGFYCSSRESLSTEEIIVQNVKHISFKIQGVVNNWLRGLCRPVEKERLISGKCYADRFINLTETANTRVMCDVCRLVTFPPMYMHACMHSCLYVCMYVCMCVYVCMYVLMYVRMYVCMHRCIYKCLCMLYIVYII